MKKLINDPQAVVDETVRGLRRGPTPVTSSWSRTRSTCTAPMRPSRARSASSAAAAAGTSRCTPGSSATACSTPPCPARCSRARRPDPIVAATKAVDGGAGVLHIVKNYTGDVLNFETAADLAGDGGHPRRDRRGRRRRRREGLALHRRPPRRRRHRPRREDRRRRRRARGRPRRRRRGRPPGQRRHAVDGRRAGARAPSRTPASRASRSPTTRSRSASASTASPAASASRWSRWTQLVDRVLEPILDDLDAPAGRRLLLFVNGMGGTPLSELYIVYRRAAEVLADRGIRGRA